MLISASDIIKKSVDLYKANFKLFLHYALLLLVPSVLVTISSVSLPLLTSMTSMNTGFLLFVLLLIISGLVTLLFTTAFMKVIVARYENMDAVHMGQNIKDSMSLMLPVIWVSILTSLAVMGGFILLIIPGIIFAIWFSFGFYATVLDGRRGVDALKYSKSLVSGRWWGVLWRAFAPAIVFTIIASIIQWIVSIPFGSSLESSETFGVAFIIYAILSSIVNMLVMPLTTSAPTILYQELKKNSIAVPTPEVPGAPEVPVA